MASNRDEHGFALVGVIVVMALLAALGAALVMATTTEVAIAANYREATETLYAAEAGVAFVMQEVAAIEDWADVALTSGESAFVDGPVDGVRTVGATTLDLAAATSDLNTTVPAGPAADPPWVLHAFGRFRDLVPSAAGRPDAYLVVWVANHSSSTDESMRGALSIFAHAYGPRGSRRAVEVVVDKVETTSLHRRSWREWP